MLQDLEITRLTENPDGSLSVSVKTMDSDHGPHRFAMALDANTYAKLPNVKAAKETALKALIKPNIVRQHADWVKREFGTVLKPVVRNKDVSSILTSNKITV